MLTFIIFNLSLLTNILKALIQPGLTAVPVARNGVLCVSVKRAEKGLNII